MTGLRMAVIGALLMFSHWGCKSPCRNETLRCYIQYEGRRPTQIRVTVQQAGTSTTRQYDGPPKETVDSIDFAFPGSYPRGETFLVTAEGFGAEGELIASAEGSATLGPECTPLTLILDSSRTPDGGIPDGGLDLTRTPFMISHLPQNYLTAGTCDLVITSTPTAVHNFNTTTGTLDGSPVPAGCQFQNENVTSSFGQGFLIGVLAVSNFTLENGATLQVTGNSPLAIVAGNNIQIDGVLDGSADHDRAGPGGFSTGPGVGGSGSIGAAGADSGGAGGSFGIPGANATSGTTGSTPAPGGTRGSTYGDPLLTAVLEAGSAGGHGSTIGPSIPGCGYAGGGGGAIQLSAGGVLQVGTSGRLYANGGGGRGGCIDNTPVTGSAHGGGGGGSGGALFLESPMIVLGDSVVLTANGGGGGSGASEATTTPASPALPGNDGQNGQTSATVAQGGATAGTRGGAGGTGAAGNITATSGLTSFANSGGGGAGYGRIVLRARTMPSSNALSSPPANTVNF